MCVSQKYYLDGVAQLLTDSYVVTQSDNCNNTDLFVNISVS